MKRIKFLPIIILSIIIASCSSDNVNDDQIDTFNVEESYNLIVHSGNSNRSSPDPAEIDMALYESLTNDQKAAVWDYKYTLFESVYAPLKQSQIEVLNELREFSKNTILSEGYDNNAAISLDIKTLEHFTQDQFFDLMYHLDIPSALESLGKSSGCFWCNYVSYGECEFSYHNGVGGYYKDILVQRSRFFIRIGDVGGQVACTMAEIIGF